VSDTLKVSDTVVLCGSLGATSAIFDAQAAALRGRIVRVEHPGHNGAPTADVRTVDDLAQRVLEQTDERFSFVGLSLGGAVGMQIALTAPERLDKLVLACTSARFGEPAQWNERAALVRDQGLEPIVDTILARWFTAGVPDGFREMFLSTDRESYARCCEALSRWDAREQLGAIESPTLVIAGEQDPSAPPEQGELIASRIPGARLEVIPNAAHLANVERPDEFNRLLEEYL
jgi:3-oxoadipate enol-lactonase